MKHIFAIAAVLALAGCDDMPRARTNAEIRELARSVAQDDAHSEVGILRQQTEALSARIQILEADNRVDTRNITTLFERDKWQQKNIQILFCNDGITASCTSMDSNSD